MYTKNSKLLLLLSFPLPSCCFLFPLAARSPGEIKVNPRRDTAISLPSLRHSCLVLFFPSICLFVSFVMRKLCPNVTNSRKTSAVRSLYKECQTYSNSLPADQHLLFLFCSIFWSVLSSCSFVCLLLCFSFNSLSSLGFPLALFI